MKRLLFFGSDFEVGLTTALSEQIVELSKVSAIFLCCVSGEKEMEPGLQDKLKEHQIRMNIIPGLDIHENFKQLVSQLERIIRENQITHVNVHNNWQLALLSFIKYRRIIPQKIKIIYTIHGYRHNSFLKSILAISFIGLALLLFADRVISMSSYVSRRFWFVGYKTDLVFYIMSKPEFNKKENQIESTPFKMVFPAQFRDGKNQYLLIDAVKKYIEKTHDNSIQLHLPGDGFLRPHCQSLVVSEGLEKNVFFPGKMSHKEVIRLYEASNIALVSSNVETYGRCIAEPFALGRCLITKKTGVALDIIKNWENGIFFDNSKDLADILISLHDNPQKVVEIGNKAFQDKNVFSTQNVINSYLKAIDKA